MKKIILCAITVFSISNLFAQTEQGKVLVGASSSFSFTNIKVEDADEGTSIFDINPSLGYFVVDNLSFGVSSEFTYSKAGDFSTSVFAIGPFLRYYFLQENIKPFLQAEFLFGSSKEKLDNDDFGFDNKANTTALGLTGGAAFFFNEFISLDAALGYVLATSKADIDNAESVKFNGLGLNLGFSLYF